MEREVIRLKIIQTLYASESILTVDELMRSIKVYDKDSIDSILYELQKEIIVQKMATPILTYYGLTFRYLMENPRPYRTTN